MDPPEEQHSAPGDRLLWRFAQCMRDYAMLAMDRQGRIVGFNEGAVQTFGYTAGELRGQFLARFLTDEDREAGVHERELRDAEHLGRALDERWHVRKDRSRFWALGITVPILETDGSLAGFGKIFRDSSDIKQLQNALQERALDLAQANEDKSIFIATLAHELRNPLSVLKQTGMLLEVSPSVDRVRIAEMIGRQVDYTQRLIDDLIDLTRVGRGKLQLKRSPIDLRELIDRSVEMIRPQAERTAIHLAVSQPPSPVMVNADAARLLQVFVNLLNNAVKFSPRGAQVDVSLDSDGEHAIVHVLDRGAGISPDQLESIFELFSQAQNEAGRRNAGLGIGLALTKDLVALHEGTIQVRSEGPGTGSDFAVRLPIVRDSSAPSH